MAIRDRVVVGIGSTVHGIAPDNVPVYDLERDGTAARQDMNGCCFPRPVGGVVGGSRGEIAGPPVKVLRSHVERMDNSTKSFGGMDYIMLFPVLFDYYQKTAYVQQGHMHLTGGQVT